MISFGQAKNNLEQLKKYLTKMQFFNAPGQKITIKELEEPNFRRANNQIFLPLVNFILLLYSSDLYIKILDIIPNLKYLPDRDFIENSLIISRKLLQMDIQLTADQFLSNKYFEKKLEFVSQLAKNVYERNEEMMRKNKKKKEVLTFGKQFQYASTITTNYVTQQLEEDEDMQEEVPQEIRAVPVKFQYPKNEISKDTVPIKKKTFLLQGEEFSEDEISFYLQNQKSLRRPQQFPQNVLSKNEDDEKYAKMSKKTDNSYSKFLLDPKKNDPKKNDPKKNEIKGKNYGKQEEREEDSVEYVSRQQFTTLLELVKTTAQTINQISGKFNQLQSDISSQMSNMSAKIYMLESNIKLIKDNL